MKRLLVLVAAVTALAAGAASSAGAYGGGAGHDTWQVGLSFNCNNPASSFCQNPETGSPELGGFWGWVEFDRFANGTITGDAQTTGCEHGIGGAGSFGAEHADVDITAAHIGPAGPDDPNPGGQVFFIDHNVVTFTGHGAPPPVTDDPDFLGDTGIPVEPGHYSFHPAPGVADTINVSFRPAK